MVKRVRNPRPRRVMPSLPASTPSNQSAAAVDRQDSPGNESVPHQKDHRRGHFFRATDTPDRQLGPAREDRLALRAKRIPERRIDHAGSYRVDPDRGQIQGQSAGQPLHCTERGYRHAYTWGRSSRIEAGHQRD
jgi:hypothetical protein